NFEAVIRNQKPCPECWPSIFAPHVVMLGEGPVTYATMKEIFAEAEIEVVALSDWQSDVLVVGHPGWEPAELEQAVYGNLGLRVWPRKFERCGQEERATPAIRENSSLKQPNFKEESPRSA